MDRLGWLGLAALLELLGCFAFWLTLREQRATWWLGLGLVSLIGFATVLTRVEVAHAGRAFAAYGGVYIAAALAWLSLVEGVRPDRWDLVGSGICLLGAAVIVLAPRA